MGSFLGWIIFGLVIGAIAKLLMPGKDPGGWIVTILLGIAGSFVGGFLASTLMGRENTAAGWIGSILGAMLLLFIYRMVIGRRRV
ncbi:MAG TPA: GlsB/YeaQ/YmgE family stress response membrane protein [Thermoanaerobaculia bacterium]|nr:GlsB/YeaQ/YmgE family stress response membrane protein [Thermoanaerobaculia bacterium]